MSCEPAYCKVRYTVLGPVNQATGEARGPVVLTSDCETGAGDMECQLSGGEKATGSAGVGRVSKVTRLWLNAVMLEVSLQNKRVNYV